MISLCDFAFVIICFCWHVDSFIYFSATLLEW